MLQVNLIKKGSAGRASQVRIQSHEVVKKWKRRTKNLLLLSTHSWTYHQLLYHSHRSCLRVPDIVTTCSNEKLWRYLFNKQISSSWHRRGSWSKNNQSPPCCFFFSLMWELWNRISSPSGRNNPLCFERKCSYKNDNFFFASHLVFFLFPPKRSFLVLPASFFLVVCSFVQSRSEMYP